MANCYLSVDPIWSINLVDLLRQENITDDWIKLIYNWLINYITITHNFHLNKNAEGFNLQRNYLLEQVSNLPIAPGYIEGIFKTFIFNNKLMLNLLPEIETIVLHQDEQFVIKGMIVTTLDSN